MIMLFGSRRTIINNSKLHYNLHKSVYVYMNGCR